MQVGFVEAGDRDGAVNILTSHDLFILSVEGEEKIGLFEQISSLFNQVRRKDIIIFSRQLATLLQAQLPFNSCLKVLSEQTKNKILKEVILEIARDIDAGIPFSQAMAKQGHIFPEYYIEMVRVGEVTGNLNEIADLFANYTEKEGALAGKIASAMIYPGVVLTLFIVVVFILIIFVYPALGSVFAENGIMLPWYTQAFLSTGTFLGKWWLAVVVVVAFLGFAGFNYFGTNEGRAVLDEAKIRLPIIRRIYTPIIMARFASSAALLVHGGIPIVQSIEIISHMTGNVLYRDILHDIAEDVRQGELLSQSIAKHPQFFPDIVPQMVAVGEKTAKVEEMLNRLSAMYTREADDVSSNLAELLQPLLIVGMGAMVGLLFASILIPIYSLTASIH